MIKLRCPPDAPRDPKEGGPRKTRLRLARSNLASNRSQPFAPPGGELSLSAYFFFSTSWPTTPPTTAPPTAPAALPPVKAEPATPPMAAPATVALSWRLMLEQAPRPDAIATANALTERIRTEAFIPILLNCLFR